MTRHMTKQERVIQLARRRILRKLHAMAYTIKHDPQSWEDPFADVVYEVARLDSIIARVKSIGKAKKQRGS